MPNYTHTHTETHPRWVEDINFKKDTKYKGIILYSFIKEGLSKWDIKPQNSENLFA